MHERALEVAHSGDSGRRAHARENIVVQAGDGQEAQTLRNDAVDERLMRAQRRLDERNARLAISLGDHAERVARRDEAGDRPRAATARERLEALRRRIGERRRQSPRRNEVEDCHRREEQATGGAGSAAPEAGEGSQESRPVGTIEVLKMQWLHAEGDRIRMTSACADGADAQTEAKGSDAAAVERAGREVGEPPSRVAEESAVNTLVANDCTAAASRVAWHTAADAMGGAAIAPGRVL